MFRTVLSAVLLGMVCASGAFAQDPGEPGRKGEMPGGGGMAMPQIMPTSPPVIAVGGTSLYVFMNGVVKRLDKKTLKLLAEKSLDEAGDDQDAFSMLDKNKDGGLTQDEVPLPPELFGRADQNGDGVITKTEVPPMLLDRFTAKAMKRMAGGPAAITVDKDDAAVFIYYLGALYRLDGKTLNIDTKVQLADELPQWLPKGEHKGENRRGEEAPGDLGKRKGEKRRDEKAPGDFPPPGEAVF
jgi:hypothetical protein